MIRSAEVSSKMSVLDEIRRRNQDPTYKTLRHVDLDVELGRRREENHRNSSRRLLRDIEMTGRKAKVVLLSEVRLQPPFLWHWDWAAPRHV